MALGVKTGGRKKGTPNKLTGDIKQAILHAFDKVGGETYLARVADKDPRTFCALIGKILPLQIHGDPSNPILIEKIERVIVDPKNTDR